MRTKADNLDAEGDTTGKAESKRKTADRANQFFGTPVRDPYGNTIYDKNGKPVIIQRPTVMQWAKDKLRRQETTTAEIQNAVVDTITKPPHYETEGDITPAEQQAAAALRNGTAATIHFAMRSMPEIPLEEWRVMSNLNEHPDFHVSAEGLQLALDFMENKVQNPATRDRVDFVVQATDQLINTYISEPSRQGYGVDTPLEPYQDLPLPEINRLREALKNAGATELLAIMDGLLEGGLADLAIDDPVRTRWLAVLVEAAPDSVSGDASIWPASMRNRIEQVRAMREWFQQKSARTVMGDPPPEGGPRNFDPASADPNGVGIPTVQDLINNPQPGSLPRIASRFVNNALKSMNALQGKSRVLAQNLVDIHIKIAEYERHLVKLHYRLKEIEGMWVNNRGREVFPDKNGNLPKSAKRVPGAMERAQELRDTLRAKYDEMVAAQDQTTVVDGKVVTIEEVQGNLQKIEGLIDEMQTKIDGIDKSAEDLINAKNGLHDKSAQMAALLGLDGVDAAPIRAAIEEDMANLPEDLEQTNLFDPKYDQVNQLIDYVNRVELVHDNLMSELDAAETQIDFINEQLENVSNAFDEGQLTQEEFDARSASLEESLAKAEARYETLDDLTDETLKYYRNAKDALESKIKQAVKGMSEKELRDFADSLNALNKHVVELEAEVDINRTNEDAINEVIDDLLDGTPREDHLAAVMEMLAVWDDYVAAGADPRLVNVNTEAINNIGKNQVADYATIEYNGSFYVLKGGANNGFWITLMNVSNDNLFRPARYDNLFKVKLTEQDIVKLKKATEFAGFEHIIPKIDKAVEYALEQIGVTVADIRSVSATEIKNKIALEKSKKELQLAPLQETRNTVSESLAASRIALENAKKNTALTRKVVIERLSDLQKLQSKTTSKVTKETVDVVDIESSIANIDNAIDYYERTGNWYGESLEVSHVFPDHRCS